MADTRKNTVYQGTFIHSTSLDTLAYQHNTSVFVDSSGTIVAISPSLDISPLLAKLAWQPDSTTVYTLPDGHFFFPGFIDTHLHASQYPNIGLFGKSTLLDWLNTYTFPLESSLSDPAKARAVYRRCIAQTLRHGTTTAAYYATVDVASTNLLADLCLAAGQRALVGRVCMDSLSPEWYRDESAEDGVRKARESAEYILGVDKEGLVRPVITPRFAPSCSKEILKGLGALAKETGWHVQTHLSENQGEIELVGEMFGGVGDGTYAGVYDAYGLLGERTILAHAIHLSEEEVKLIGERGAKVSHCPCSNSAITSGEARVRWLMDSGVGVGLGTDMSGGYSPSVLEAARQALLVSRHVAMKGGERDKLSVEEVLYLATRGGAEVVGLGGKVGGFEVGMEWDAQEIGLGVVDNHGEGGEGNVDVFGWESWEERVAKWLFNGDDRNTKRLWVKGRLVHERK